jgi:hypothetical protein
MKVLGHLLKTLFQAFFRIVFTAILSAALAVSVGLLVAYEASKQWPPQQSADVLIAIVAVLFTYAASLTVLVSEAVKALLYSSKEAVKETYTAGNIIERGVKAAEHLEQANEQQEHANVN